MNARALRTSIVFLVSCGGASAPIVTSTTPPAPSASTSTPTSMVSAVTTPAPSASASASTALAAPQTLTPESHAFPEGKGDIGYDVIAYDGKHRRVFVPMVRGEVGDVEVYDVASSSFSRVGGFKTAEKEFNGKKRRMGPSAAAVGDGVVYVANRGGQEVCVVDAVKLTLGKCTKLPVSPDIVAYLPSLKEVWVTSPHEKTIVYLDATKSDALKIKSSSKFDGSPEGAAVDDAHGVFYTNFEDADRTVALDVKTHAVKSNWTPSCGSDGPRGLVVDADRGFLVVACTDHAQVLGVKIDGKNLGKVDTGAGVDIIDYLPSKKLVYVAAGKAAKLTVARLEDDGTLTVVATGASAERARNGVVDEGGRAYIVDPVGARLLVFPSPQ